jgi:hypothetical protein
MLTIRSRHAAAPLWLLCPLLQVDQMSCITEVMGPLPVSMVRDAPKRKRYFGDDGNPTPPQNTKNVTRRSV